MQVGMHLVSFIASRPWGAMSAVSLRLPGHLEQQLSEEARLSGQPRSQLLREALETLLSQRREERAQAALRLAAEALASDADACAEAQELAADFLMAENEALAGAEAPATSTSTEPWWR
jgi:metal-responsive CopG/Arc/MetJ family transcriptional regulator